MPQQGLQIPGNFQLGSHEESRPPPTPIDTPVLVYLLAEEAWVSGLGLQLEEWAGSWQWHLPGGAGKGLIYDTQHGIWLLSSITVAPHGGVHAL